MPGFAIVGCGMIARFHARALAEVPGARLIALVSRGPNAAKMKQELGLECDTYADLAPALARKDVDVVIVTTPSGAHQEPAVAAANAGKHVVVEKPLEITLERCDRIIDACDRNKVKLCTIFPSRFGDANQVVKLAIDGGRFGSRSARPPASGGGRNPITMRAAGKGPKRSTAAAPS